MLLSLSPRKLLLLCPPLLSHIPSQRAADLSGREEGLYSCFLSPNIVSQERLGWPCNKDLQDQRLNYAENVYFLFCTAHRFWRSDSSLDGPSLWNGILRQAAEPEAAEKIQLQYPAGCNRAASHQQQRLVQPPLLRTRLVLNNCLLLRDDLFSVIEVWVEALACFLIWWIYIECHWIVKTMPVTVFFEANQRPELKFSF